MGREIVLRSDGVTLDLQKQEADRVYANAKAMQIVTVEGYIQRLAYNSDGMVEYIGLAVPGTLDSALSWQIRKLTYSGTNVTSIDFADGNLNFDNSWDLRVTGYLYS
jgi:hypothetical protein